MYLYLFRVDKNKKKFFGKCIEQFSDINDIYCMFFVKYMVGYKKEFCDV